MTDLKSQAHLLPILRFEVDEYEKYIPADYKLTFSWIDSQGQEQEENLMAVKNR